ncbi:DedA family protein [candidate division KSB1 bacterium]
MISCYLENIFPPLPGDSVVVIGAYLVGIGYLKFELTYIVTGIGSILGLMTLYYVGVIFKKNIIHRKNNESKLFDKINLAEHWFKN